MKRLSAMLLILCMMPVFAWADIDLSSMTYEELRELQEKIAAEIVKRPEWKGVDVSPGNWRVGPDIPPGAYSVTLKDSRGSCFFAVWGYAVNDYTTNGGLVYNQLLYQDKQSIGRIELLEGQVVEISNPVVFKPAERLGF